MRTNGRPADAILRALSGGEIQRTDLAAAAGLDQRACSEGLAALIKADQIAENDGVISSVDNASTDEAKSVGSTDCVDGDAEGQRVPLRERRTIGPGGFLREVGVPLINDTVPQRHIDKSRVALDQEYREERTSLGLQSRQRQLRKRKAKREALLAHALEHGAGEAAWRRWQRICKAGGRLDWCYRDRKSYHRAASNALKSHRDEALRELLLTLGLTECEERERPDGSVIYVWT